MTQFNTRSYGSIIRNIIFVKAYRAYAVACT